MVSTFPASRCATCPRTKPGACFAQTSNGSHLCQRHADGDLTYAPLLTGEVVQTPVGSRPTRPTPTTVATTEPTDAEASAAFPAGCIPIGRIPRDKRIRVGFVSPVMLQGGAEEWHRLLLLNLESSGRYVVTGLAVGDPDHANARTMAPIAAKVPTGFGRVAIQALLDTSEIVVAWAFDLSTYRIPPGVRVVGISHGDGSSHHAVAAASTVAAAATDWVAVSPSAYLPPGVQGTVIPNGADLARLLPGRSRDDVRAALGLKPENKAVLFVGRLAVDDKRVDLVIDVVAELPEHYTLVLVGDGWDAGQILARARERLPGRFRHVAWTDNPGDYMHAADVGMLASRTESFGIVLAEMLACGLPVVSTDVGMAAMHPECFRVVPRDATPATIAAAILADRRPRDRTARGAELVRREYSAAAFVRRWEDYLASIAPPPPELPSVWAMARNLVGSMAAQIAAGNPVLTEAQTAARLAVCEVCPQRIPGAWRCGGMTGCGCHLTEKAPLATADCPSGRWPRLEPTPC